MVDVRCNRCEEIKDSTFDFYWSQDKRQRWCKTCQLEYGKLWHRQHNARVKERNQRHDGAKTHEKGEHKANKV